MIPPLSLMLPWCCDLFRCYVTAAAAAIAIVAIIPPLLLPCYKYRHLRHYQPWYRRLLPWCRHLCRCCDTAAAAVVVIMPLLLLPYWYRHLHHYHDTAAAVISIIHHCYCCREGGWRDLCRCRDNAAAAVAIVAMIPSLIILCWIVVMFVRSNRFLIASIIVVFVRSW